MSIVGISGVGLIGGSLAAAIKKYIPTSSVVGYDPDTKAAENAYAKNLIVKVENTFVDLANSVDILFLASPVSSVLEQLSALHSFSRDLIVSDMCSVKLPILKAAETLPGNMIFVGGHPMAGSQKAGNEYAYPDLFQRAPYALCPSVTDHIPKELTKLITGIGAHPIVISPEIHDKAVAKVSHIPQLLAVALLNVLMNDDSTDYDIARKLAAGGFNDMTRIGESPYPMWKDVIKYNKQNIIAELNTLIVRLNEYKELIRSNETGKVGEEFLRAGKARKNIRSHL